MIIMGVVGTDLFHYCFLQQFAVVNGFGLEKIFPVKLYIIPTPPPSLVLLPNFMQNLHFNYTFIVHAVYWYILASVETKNL